MKSEEFRNNPMFLRNQFKGDGVFEIPKIEKEELKLENVELIGYDKLSENETDKIITIDYAQTNNYTKEDDRKKGYIKKATGYVLPYNEKGMGSAGGGNRIIAYPGNDPTKSPGDDFEW